VWCPTYGYLPSHSASPPFDRYQITMIGARGTCVWTTCPMLLTKSGTVGSRSLRQESDARTFEIWAVHSCLCSYGSCKHSSPDVAKFTYFNTQQFKSAHPIHSWSLRMMLQVHCIQNNSKKTKKLNYILKIKPDIFLQHPKILTSRQIIIIIINRFV